MNGDIQVQGKPGVTQIIRICPPKQCMPVQISVPVNWRSTKVFHEENGKRRPADQDVARVISSHPLSFVSSCQEISLKIKTCKRTYSYQISCMPGWGQHMSLWKSMARKQDFLVGMFSSMTGRSVCKSSSSKY